MDEPYDTSQNDSQLRCMKLEVAVDHYHPVCRDPRGYCKFRTACPIWFMTKERRRMQRREQGDGIT